MSKIIALSLLVLLMSFSNVVAHCGDAELTQLHLMSILKKITQMKVMRKREKSYKNNMTNRY